MWHKAESDVIESWEASTYCPFFLLQLIWSRTKNSHDQAIKAPEATWNQFIFILKTCILWFMDQAHESQMGKLREMWLGGHQGDPSRVPSKGSKIDTWFGVIQSALGSSDSSSSITKIISLKHVLIPSAKANQHSMLSQNPSCYYPKQQEPSKSWAYHS